MIGILTIYIIGCLLTLFLTGITLGGSRKKISPRYDNIFLTVLFWPIVLVTGLGLLLGEFLKGKGIL